MKRALVACFFFIACGGSVSPDPASKSTVADGGAPGASPGADGGAARCSPRPGCSSLEQCSSPCEPGAAWASTCTCVRGEWQCGGNTCPTTTPTVPPVDQCPPTSPPKPSDTCSASSEGLMCDYGECQPQCYCKGGKWNCAQDDCVPAMPPCPAAVVSSGDACKQVLQKCEYTVPGDKLGCICAIDERWVCGPIN